MNSEAELLWRSTTWPYAIRAQLLEHALGQNWPANDSHNPRGGRVQAPTTQKLCILVARCAPGRPPKTTPCATSQHRTCCHQRRQCQARQRRSQRVATPPNQTLNPRYIVLPNPLNFTLAITVTLWKERALWLRKSITLPRIRTQLSSLERAHKEGPTELARCNLLQEKERSSPLQALRVMVSAEARSNLQQALMPLE